MIKRTLFEQLKKHLSKKEFSLIIGPRQCGKTFLMFLLKEFLEQKGEKTVMLNFDIENDRPFFASQDKLAQKIMLEIGKRRGYVFLDEIQRKTNAGLFLKGLYDMNLPYKFIISGSGSVELKESIHESLAGRKRIFELNTLSFEEFVNFKTNYKYENKLADFFGLEHTQTERLLGEYLNFGGYPRVVLEEQLEEKRRVINEVYQSYLEKDIFRLLNVQKSETFTDLLKIMASQVGSLVNFSELSSTLSSSVKTIKNYLWYLQKTFILQKVAPYFQNIRKEISKTPLFYFYDLGLRNHIINEFGRAVDSGGVGFLFENFVFNILKEKTEYSAAKINFWRTKDGAEVDFLVNSGSSVIPIEVKYSSLKKLELTRSMKSFITKYNPPKTFVVNLTLEQSLKIENTKVFFIPFTKLLALDFINYFSKL